MLFSIVFLGDLHWTEPMQFKDGSMESFHVFDTHAADSEANGESKSH